SLHNLRSLSLSCIKSLAHLSTSEALMAELHSTERDLTISIHRVRDSHSAATLSWNLHELYQPNKGKCKGKGKPKDDKKKAACYVCRNEDHMSPKCPDRLLPKIQWKDPDQYVDYGKKLNLNQIGATVPATVPGTSPVTSIITGGTLSVARSLNTPLRLAGTTVRQGFDATPARSPQVVKTGYFDTSNAFHKAIKGTDENGNDVYLIPCPTGETNVELQSDWHYASENEDLPDHATEADQVVAPTPPFVMVSSCMDSVKLRKSSICTLTWVAEFLMKKDF
ncbi:unnamed protein product, partial [Cylindrotheca closterium]